MGARAGRCRGGLGALSSSLPTPPPLPSPHAAQISSIAEEYFSSGDIQNAADSLDEMEAPQFMYWAVKRLVTAAMDKRPHEREMASVLLSALYGEAVSSDQMQTGFIKLLEAVRGAAWPALVVGA